MKKMNNVIRMMKNLVFDLLVIVGGIAVIVLIGKALLKGNDDKITTVKAKAETITNDEAKYSDKLEEFMDDLESEINEELYGSGKEDNKNRINYEKEINYLGAGIYNVEYLFDIYGSDKLVLTIYVDTVEEDGVAVYTLNGVRVDEYVLYDIYPEIFE